MVGKKNQGGASGFGDLKYRSSAANSSFFAPRVVKLAHVAIQGSPETAPSATASVRGQHLKDVSLSQVQIATGRSHADRRNKRLQCSRDGSGRAEKSRLRRARIRASAAFAGGGASRISSRSAHRAETRTPACSAHTMKLPLTPEVLMHVQDNSASFNRTLRKPGAETIPQTPEIPTTL